jgi:uncharacterized protein
MVAPEEGEGARAPAAGLTPVEPVGRQIVESYGPGRFRVSGRRHDGSILILPERTLAWHVTDMDGVTAEGMAAVTGTEPPVDLLLIGCGARIRPAPADLRAALRAAGIALELMDTGAAGRTYNLLVAEDRRVAAALIVLPGAD